MIRHNVKMIVPSARRAVRHRLTALLFSVITLVPQALAAQDEEDLAKDFVNPLSDLISLPFQNNSEFGLGTTDDAYRNTLNVQPVYPFEVNWKWNAISRAILPIVFQEELAPGVGDRFGTGDLLATLWLSPKWAEAPMWGVGPALVIPTATSEFIGAGKWSVGPSVIGIWVRDEWTFGGLAHQLWSFTGDSQRSDVSLMYLQPFAARTWRNGVTVLGNLEATRDWTNDTWNVPLNLQASKVTMWGAQPIVFGAGLKFYLATPDGGPDWGIRLLVTLLYPK